MSVALVVAGLLVGAREYGVEQLSVPVILAGALAVVGLGLIAGAWYGRSRWLVVPGALLAITTVAAASLDVPITGGIGDRHWQPLAVDQVHSAYHLGIGDATLDLRNLGGALVAVHATVGLGNLVVIVPRTTAVDVRARSGAGEVDVLGRQDNGLTATLHVTRPAAGPDTGLITVVARVGAGRVEVRRA
jgi:hypothetical protein